MKKIKLSIRSILLFGFGGLLVASLAITLILGFSTATQNTLTLLAGSAQSLVSNTTQVITNDLKKFEHQAKWVGEAFAMDRISLDRPEELEAFLVGTMAATENISGMAVIDQDGTIYEISKNFPRLHKISAEPSLMTQLKLQYQIANRSGSFWDTPIWLPEIQQTIVNLRTIITTAQNKRILFVQGITIETLSRLLLGTVVDEHHMPFVIYNGEYVLAHPNLTKHIFKANPTNALPRLDQVNDPTLAAFAQSQQLNWKALSLNTDIQGRLLDQHDEEQLFLFKEVTGLMDKPLIFGVHLDNEGSSKELDRLLITAGGALLTVLISLLVLYLMSRRLARPLARLARASVLIGENKLYEPLQLPDSRVLELDQAAKAFNNMVTGLQEREKIRGLFGKIMPERVAEAMLNATGSLKPQKVVGTVLFCDLADFTSLSEKLEPETIVEVLNGFFTDMVEIIEFHGGIITQFQGDAILAVFNVPLADPDHASKAILAANAMLSRAKTKRYLGHSLKCRIGVNTGQMVAGNVGAESRMNYTVHGDAVNTASRLENMNKEYGSSLLISASSHDLAPNFNYKLLGDVPIRGRNQSLKIYTITEDNHD